MNKTRPNIFLIMVLLLGICLNVNSVQAQIVNQTGAVEPAITGSQVFYAGVYLPDTDQNAQMDALVGLTDGPSGAWGSFSCIIRFNSANTDENGFYIDAHNGSGYSVDDRRYYEFGDKVELWFEVDLASKTYLPYVQTADMTEPVPILFSAGFRNASVTQLDTWTSATSGFVGNDSPDILISGVVASVGDRPAEYNEVAVSSISFNPPGLNEVFDPAVTSYTATFPSGTTSTLVSAVTDYGTEVSNTGSYNVSAGEGQLVMVASSWSGTASTTYTIDWEVNDPTNDATLKTLTLSEGTLVPEFNPGVYEYEVALPYGTPSITLTAEPNFVEADVSGDGVLSLDGGSGVATIEVESSNGENSLTYTVTAVNEQHRITDVYIDYTQWVSGADPTSGTQYFGAFEDGVYEYVKRVPNAVLSISNLVVQTNSPNEDAIIEFDPIPEDAFDDGEETVYINIYRPDLSDYYSYEITFRTLESDAEFTKFGKFPSPLTGNHVIYSKLSVPSGVPADILFALSDGFMSTYPQFGPGFRFVQIGEDSLSIDIRNGGAYENIETNPIGLYDVVYHCWLDLDIENSTYSLYVKKQGDVDYYAVGEDALFRNSDVTSLDRWGVYKNGVGAASDLNALKVIEVDNVGDMPSEGSISSLSSIELSVGEITGFDPGTTTYDVDVPFGTSTVDVKGVPTDSASHIIGNGPVTISGGTATATIQVFADDNSGSTTYTVNITEESENTDAYLSDMTVSIGELTPSFESTLFDYSLSVPFGTTSLTISTTTNVDGATVAGDGEITISGDEVLEVDVLATDGITSLTYTIDLTVLSVSDDATLKGLGTSIGYYDSKVTEGDLEYLLTIPFGTDSVTIYSLLNDANASKNPAENILIKGLAQLTNGGDAADTSIVVTAQDGTTELTYSVSVFMTLPSADNNLKSISSNSIYDLSPAFDAATTSYTLDVPYGTTEVTIEAEANHFGAVVAGTGTLDVSSGSATASIEVTAQTGDVKTYSVVVTVLPGGTDATLSDLSVDGGTLVPVFDAAVFEYISVVPLGTTSADVVATLTDPLATLTGSGSIDVITGSGVANIVVTSEDGANTNTYVVEVYVGSAPEPEPELGINENISGLKLFPNPVVETLNIELPKVGSIRAEVYDINGVVYSKASSENGSLGIDVSGLSKGLYFVRVRANGVSVVEKFVKAK